MRALSGDEKRDLDRGSARKRRSGSRAWTAEQCDRAATRQKPGIALCVDLSATPFYIKGSGHPEGRPFPWLVSDFGLVDAIESGIVEDSALAGAGHDRPAGPEVFQAVAGDHRRAATGRAAAGPGRTSRSRRWCIARPKPALKQIAGQWVERFKYIQRASPGQERVAAGAHYRLRQHRHRRSLLSENQRRK